MVGFVGEGVGDGWFYGRGSAYYFYFLNDVLTRC